MRISIKRLAGIAMAAAIMAAAAGPAAAASAVITVASPSPHTPLNTPYLANGRLLTVDDIDGDVVDVRITLDRGTVTLGAAPAADVIDPGGDANARVIGTPAEVKPALDGITITPATDDQLPITGAVWVFQDGASVAGHSLEVVVDDGAVPGTCTPAGGDGSGAANQAPTISAPAEVSAGWRSSYQFRGSIAVADPDAGAGQLKVRLSVPAAWWGDFTLPQTSGLTFTQGDGITDHQVEFCGTVADLNAALAQLQFTDRLNGTGYRTFAMTVDDLGNSGSGGPRTASATVGVHIGPVAPSITVASPSPHTPLNTPYLANGRLLTVDDIDGDVVDVRITLDRGTVTLGAAPAADVIDPGGDANARVIGTPAEVKPALDGITITPATDDQLPITGAVWVHQDGLSMAGRSLEVIVDGPAAIDGGPGETGARRAGDAPAPRSVLVGGGGSRANAAAPIARVSLKRVGRRTKLSAHGSSARGGRLAAYRWTGPHGRLLSRKATLWLRVRQPTKVTLTVVDSRGRRSSTTVVVKPIRRG